MEKEFVTVRLALKLKALGFNWKCFAVSTKTSEEFEITDPDGWDEVKHGDLLVKRPTYSQAFRWFREECGIWVTFEYDDCDCVEADICWYVGKCFRYGIGPLFLTNELGDFKTLQEAELACLEKLLEICSSK